MKSFSQFLNESDQPKRYRLVMLDDEVKNFKEKFYSLQGSTRKTAYNHPAYNIWKETVQIFYNHVFNALKVSSNRIVGICDVFHDDEAEIAEKIFPGLVHNTVYDVYDVEHTDPEDLFRTNLDWIYDAVKFSYEGDTFLDCSNIVEDVDGNMTDFRMLYTSGDTFVKHALKNYPLVLFQDERMKRDVLKTSSMTETEYEKLEKKYRGAAKMNRYDI